jgi:hypothetical protein
MFKAISKINPVSQYSNGEAVLPAKVVLANYIVRIYRLDKKNPRHLVGVVEEVGVKGKKAFTNYDELWEILISSKSTTQKQRRKEVK